MTNKKFKTPTEQAKAEILEEEFRAAVEVEKLRLREKRSVWERIFPYAITIRRK